MGNKKFCKVTFYADLTNDDKQFLLNDFAQTMTEAAQIDSVCGVSVTDPNDERAEELLNNAISFISIGRNIHETIEKLIECGFTHDDLVAYGFNEEDISDVEGGDEEGC